MALETVLEFEKPIVDLRKKIDEMKLFSQDSDQDMDDIIIRMEEKLARLKQDVYGNLSRWQRVQIARHPKRPYTLDYVHSRVNDFHEIHGDRHYADDLSIVGGLGRLGTQGVMIIGHQKGRDTRENIRRNFGMPNPEGYRKALRLMKIAEKFKLPVITFIDTSGAYPGIEAEERGQAEAIARNLYEMAGLKVPIISVVIGEGGSGGALALAVANRVLMLENSIYSVISPEGCSSILFKDALHAADMAEALRLSSADLKDLMLIDEVIPEPQGGAHLDYETVIQSVWGVVERHLTELVTMSEDELTRQRVDKYGQMGVWKE